MSQVPDRFRYELQLAHGEHDPKIGYQWTPIAGATVDSPMLDLMIRLASDPTETRPAEAFRVVIVTEELGGNVTETVIAYCGVPQ